MSNAVETIEEGKKYNLRPIGAKDIFPMSRIIAKIGLKNFKRVFQSEEVKKMVKSAREEGKSEKNLEAVGAVAMLEIADVLFENFPNCEKELFAFVASLTDLKVYEVENIPPAEFLELIISIIKKPEFKDFFGAALRLLK